MRCPDCNKFVSLELQEPELDISVEHEKTDVDTHLYTVTGTCRIVRNCGECGQELKEATLDVSAEVEVPAEDMPEGIDAEDCDVQEDGLEPIEEGGGRYAKSYFGAILNFSVNIGSLHSGKTHSVKGEWSDKVAASSMDELV